MSTQNLIGKVMTKEKMVMDSGMGTEPKNYFWAQILKTFNSCAPYIQFMSVCLSR